MLNLKQPGGFNVKSVSRHHCTPTGMVARVHVYVCQYIIYTRTRLSLFSLEHTCTSTCIHFSLSDSVCRFSLVHKQGHGRQRKQHQFRARTQTAQITLRPLLWRVCCDAFAYTRFKTTYEAAHDNTACFSVRRFEFEQ